MDQTTWILNFEDAISRIDSLRERSYIDQEFCDGLKYAVLHLKPLSAKLKCPTCDGEISEEDSICNSCGQRLIAYKYDYLNRK